MKPREAELIRQMYERDNYICQNCGAWVGNKQGQRAHVLGNTKLNRKLYGDAVIDHIDNWRTACSLACNKELELSSNKVSECVAFAAEIEEKINEG